MPKTIKRLLTTFLMGAFMVSSAWAGSSLVPVSHETTKVTVVAGKKQTHAVKKRRQQRVAATPATKPTAADAPVTVPSPTSLKAGQVLAGAAKMSTEPRPQDY